MMLETVSREAKRYFVRYKNWFETPTVLGQLEPMVDIRMHCFTVLILMTVHPLVNQNLMMLLDYHNMSLQMW